MGSGQELFVSYAPDTKRLARKLARDLEKHGYHAWADFKDLQPGQDWRIEMERALESAQWLVFVLSPTSTATPFQEAEWRAALAKALSDSPKKVLPVMVGGSEPPPFLRNWVGLRVDPALEPSEWTSRVISTLRSELPQPSGKLRALNRRRRLARLAEISRAAKRLGGRPAKPAKIPPAAKQ
jgi:hypothetical protein